MHLSTVIYALKFHCKTVNTFLERLLCKKELSCVDSQTILTEDCKDESEFLFKCPDILCCVDEAAHDKYKIENRYLSGDNHIAKIKGSKVDLLELKNCSMQSFKSDLGEIDCKDAGHFAVDVRYMDDNECTRVFNAMDDVLANTTQALSSAVANTTERVSSVFANTTERVSSVFANTTEMVSSVFANTTEALSSAVANTTEVLNTTIGDASQHQDEDGVDKSTLATVGILASLALGVSVATFFACRYFKNNHMFPFSKNNCCRPKDEEEEIIIDGQSLIQESRVHFVNVGCSNQMNY